MSEADTNTCSETVEESTTNSCPDNKSDPVNIFGSLMGHILSETQQGMRRSQDPEEKEEDERMKRRHPMREQRDTKDRRKMNERRTYHGKSADSECSDSDSDEGDEGDEGDEFEIMMETFQKLLDAHNDLTQAFLHLTER
jgi:hypothetical protein